MENIYNNWNEICKKAEEVFENCQGSIYVMACFTDSFELDIYNKTLLEDSGLLGSKKELLLDLRIFDKKRELRFVRGSIARDFQMVYLDDSDYQDTDVMENEQLLDIDIARTEKERCFEQDGMVKATGGGYYKLPFTGYQDIKVVIKNYIAYDENGCAYVKAWRLAGFRG